MCVKLLFFKEQLFFCYDHKTNEQNKQLNSARRAAFTNTFDDPDHPNKNRAPSSFSTFSFSTFPFSGLLIRAWQLAFFQRPATEVAPDVCTVESQPGTRSRPDQFSQFSLKHPSSSASTA